MPEAGPSNKPANKAGLSDKIVRLPRDARVACSPRCLTIEDRQIMFLMCSLPDGHASVDVGSLGMVPT